MLRRALFAILIAFLAIPAMAASHCVQPVEATATVAQHIMQDGTHHQPAVPARGHEQGHDCIGCIAPFAKHIDRLAESLSYAAPVIRPLADIDGLTRHSGAPEPPPPRSFA